MSETSSSPGPPLYHQIARVLRSRIFHGLYAPGAPIPSENELAVEFGVARLTVRQAIQELRREGALISRRGSGTFVPAGFRMVRPMQFTGYLEDFILQSLTLDTKLDSIRTVVAPAAVLRAYDLAPGAKVVRVERTRFADGVPAQWSINHLLPVIANKLPLRELHKGSLTEMLSRDARIETTSATQRFTAVAADGESSQALKVSTGAPLLFVETIGYDGARAINFTWVYYRPERVFFTASLNSVAGDPRMRIQTLPPPRTAMSAKRPSPVTRRPRAKSARRAS